MSEDVRHRLFVAIEVREPARAALERAVAPMRETFPGLRWTEPDTWHLTLAFLGSVDAYRAAAVDEAAAAVAASRPPFDVRLNGHAGSFGGSVLYASIDEDEPLMRTAADLRAELEECGFDMDERSYVPHCTLARVPRGVRLPPQLLADFPLPSVRWTVRRIVVLRSRLRVGGAVHEIRSAHELPAASSFAEARTG